MRQRRSADLQSAVTQNCILQAVLTVSGLKAFDTLPIANRRYDRLQICATVRSSVIHQRAPRRAKTVTTTLYEQINPRAGQR